MSNKMDIYMDISAKDAVSSDDRFTMIAYTRETCNSLRGRLSCTCSVYFYTIRYVNISRAIKN